MLGDVRGRPLMAATRPASTGRARQRRQRGASEPPPLLLVALVLLGVVLVALMALYYWAPDQAVDVLLQEPAELGSAAEVQALHAAPSQRFCGRPAPPLVCAHGGDTSVAPPNTAEAFQAALDAGALCVEVDVARTRDGQLVVLHSRELEHLLQGAEGGARRRRGGPPPQVGDHTWAALSRLRWAGGQRVERVEAVLQRVLPHVRQVTLDIKTHVEDGEEVGLDVVAAQVAALVAHQPGCGPEGGAGVGKFGPGRCLVWAKSDALLRELADAAGPHLRLGYVVMNETAQARAAGLSDPLRLSPIARVLAMHYAMATPQLVDALHAAGQEVHVWTANTAAMMRQALDSGADAVVTNRPSELAAAVNSRLQECQRRRAME